MSHSSNRHIRSAVMGALVTACVLAGCTNKAEDNVMVAAANNGAEAAAASSDDPVASAMSAAPAAIAQNATIVQPAADGSMTTLRAGTNGWTCMPDSPATPGPDPMCMDANAAKWAEAWMGHKTPPANTVGVMYMLRGGTDASNTDPYAQKPTEENKWIETGPHVMVVGSKEVLAGHPTSPDPDTKMPYVMWDGTPYAHLMVPVQ